MRPYNQILHEYRGKLYFITNDNQLAQLDPLTFRCEVLGIKNLESIESNHIFITTLASDGELSLLYQTEEAKTIKISRDCSFIKVTATESHVVVVGWREKSKEAVFLLYDHNLRFKDEISLKQSTLP